MKLSGTDEVSGEIRVSIFKEVQKYIKNSKRIAN